LLRDNQILSDVGKLFPGRMNAALEADSVIKRFRRFAIAAKEVKDLIQDRERCPRDCRRRDDFGSEASKSCRPLICV
jgi:hypothetical protein